MANDLIQFTAQIELQAAGAGTPRRLKVLAYSGNPMSVPGYASPVLIDVAGLDVPARFPLLGDHQNALNAVLGSGGGEVRGGQLFVSATLADTEAARQVVALLESGVQLQASVGVRPITTKPARAGDKLAINGRTIEIGAAGATVVVAGQLKEVSIVAIAADPNTAVSLAAKEGEIMEAGQTTTSNAPEDPVAERARQAGIIRACAGRHAEIEAQAISEGWTVDKTHLEVMRAERPRVPAVTHATRGEPASRDVLAAAALMVAGYTSTAEHAFGADICMRAADLHCTNALDLCRAALQAEHRDIPHGRDELIRAGFSTLSMPNALGLSAEKVLAETFTQTPATWPSWAGRKPVRNFKQNTAIRPYFLGGRFEEVGATGELKNAAIGEEVYTFQAHTSGKMFTVTRQELVNDNLGTTFELSREIARQALRAISDEVYRLLLANTGNFFATGNGNYLSGADTALAAASLQAAIQKFREAVDADGMPVDVTPSVLVVPPALEFTAKSLVASANLSRAATEDLAPSGNPLLNIAAVEVEPRLANTKIHANASAKAWYLMANPAQVPALVVAFLNGVEMPIVEQVPLPGDVLGIGYRGYIDFGASFADTRGGVRVKGEA